MIDVPVEIINAAGLQELLLYVTTPYLPQEIYELNSLTSLTLQGKIKTLDKDISKLKNLSEIIMHDSRIKQLPITVSQLSKLKKVSFWQAIFSDEKPVKLDLSSIIDVLADCENLKEVSFSKNGIISIPDSIGKLKKIQKLSFADNELEEIPDAIFELENLTELDLGINQLKHIPEGIEQLTKLKVLKIHSNWKNKFNPHNLFHVIHKLPNLDKLELWSNQSIRELPETISELSKLKVLDVDNNLLTDLPMSIFTMKHLKKLRVSTNNISPEVIDKLKSSLPDTKLLS